MMAVAEKKKRNIERSYWIAVVKTVDFDEDFSISMLLGKRLTRSIVISKPCYSDVYHQMVRYASFSFFKSIPKSYFGPHFYEKNELVPILNATEWLKGKRDAYHELMKPVGIECEYINECKRVEVMARDKIKDIFI